MTIDGYMLACYRRHCGSLTDADCHCSADGPDRDCDLGWALWKCANRRKADA
jgi:hypothetical protein